MTEEWTNTDKFEYEILGDLVADVTQVNNKNNMTEKKFHQVESFIFGMIAGIIVTIIIFTFYGRMW